MGPPSESDRAQGDALCDELCQQIVELDKGSAKLLAALEKLEKRGVAQSALQTSRLQRQVRELSTERRQIVKMLNTLGHSYPCDHRRTYRPTGGQ